MTGRAVVLTGAGSGIGRAIAAAFAKNGDTVYALDISEAGITETARQLAEYELHPFTGDVSRYEDIKHVVDTAAANHEGHIDVMVAAAGVYDAYAGIEDTSPELWDRIISINLTGVFNAHRAAAFVIRPQTGRLITIGSIGAVRGAADGIAYAASKGGLEGMNHRLALDVAEMGVTSNIIAPGAIETSIQETSKANVGHLHPEVQRRKLPADVFAWLIPLKRMGQPSEIASLAVFLASQDAGYITGQTITVDGGWTAQ